MSHSMLNLGNRNGVGSATPLFPWSMPVLGSAWLRESDFRVLEGLLHKGPMPVNAIGSKVYLNPGSVTVAVDRLYKKGFASRVECGEDGGKDRVPG